MNGSRVTVIVVEPTGEREQYDFDEPETCVVGRAHDCDIRIDEPGRPHEISRHHCLFEIDPPEIRVHDLRSTNGTYVNGRRVSDSDRRMSSTGMELKSGDQVRVGSALVQVAVAKDRTDPE